MDDEQIYEEEKNKFSFRYTNAGILSVFLILSILSLFLSFFFQKSDILYRENLYDYAFDMFPEAISNSLYENDDIYYGDKMVNDTVKYAIRGSKIKNFENTEDFKKRYPDEVIVRNLDNQIVFRTNREDFEYQKEEYEGKGYTNNLDTEYEEPVETVTYLSNLDNIDDNIDPQEYEVKPSKGVYTVRGFYENGKLKITSEDMPGKEYTKFASSFRKSLNNEYRNINSKYYGIKKLNFMYTVDFNSKAFNNYLNGRDYHGIILPSKIIGMSISLALLVGFTMISNYKKLKGVSFVEGIKRFPIEVVFMCTIAWFIPLFVVTDISIIKQEMNIWLFVFQFIMVYFASNAIYYYVLGLKSLYNEGSKSFIFQNSILVKLCKSLITWSKKSVLKATKFSQENIDVTDNSLGKLRMFCIGLIVLGTAGAVISVKFGLRFVVWVLWVILVIIFYNMSKKYMIDLNNINEKSKEIADGNYGINIDENETYFKGVAHSFNTISDNLSTAVEDAVKSERMKTELITNVSHDLKTPLTSIINYSDLIINENTSDEEKNEYATVIYEKSIKLKHLIEDLFEVSKASSGNIDLNLEDIDLRAVIMQIAGEWEDKFAEKNLEIVLNLSDESIILNLDGNKTSRVLDNLFSNIYKYAMPNTRVYVDLKQEDGTVFTIKNISNYALNIKSEELMDRFKRGDESRNTEGSGLGLSIASSLVSAQGGKFNIEIDGDLFKTEILF